jgi:uncharacterized membrane protein (UPF0127 family)
MGMPRLIQRIGKKWHLVKVKHARTMHQRFMGLMGVPAKQLDYGLVFHLPPHATRMHGSIHMMFMRTPIDVIYVDAQQKVLECVKELPMWTLNYTPKQPARFLIELPPGTIQKCNITKGSHVSWD